MIKASKQSSYLFQVDLIRVIAILGVLSIHLVHSVYARPDFVGGVSWWLANWWNTLSRISVPLFIMLSGFLLLPRQENYQSTVKRAVTRLIIPLVFWNLVYLGLNQSYITLDHYQFIPMLTSLFQGNVFHLYFIVIMIGLYAVSPLLSKRLSTLKNSHRWLMMWILLVIGNVLFFVEYTSQRFFLNNSFLMWIPYVGYFMAGYCFGLAKLSRYQLWICCISFLASMVVIGVASWRSVFLLEQGYTWLNPAGALSPYFESYVSPLVTIMSVSAFVLLLHFPVRSTKNNSWITRLVQLLASASFGMYLVHGLVLDIIDVKLHLSLDFVSIPILPYLLIKGFAVLSISFLISLGLNYFRLTSWSVGKVLYNKPNDKKSHH